MQSCHDCRTVADLNDENRCLECEKPYKYNYMFDLFLMLCVVAELMVWVI
jgi:hypothetical protein